MFSRFVRRSGMVSIPRISALVLQLQVKMGRVKRRSGATKSHGTVRATMTTGVFLSLLSLLLGVLACSGSGLGRAQLQRPSPSVLGILLGSASIPNAVGTPREQGFQGFSGPSTYRPSSVLGSALPSSIAQGGGSNTGTPGQPSAIPLQAATIPSQQLPPINLAGVAGAIPQGPLASALGGGIGSTTGTGNFGSGAIGGTLPSAGFAGSTAPNPKIGARVNELIGQKLHGFVPPSNMGSAAAPGGGGILGSPTATSSAGSGGVIHHHPATSSQFFSTSSSATTSSKTSAQPQQPIANAVDPLDGASLAKHSEHLLNYFRNIVESAFSPEFQAWFPPSEVLMTSSGNMIEWKCQDVIQLAYEIRRQALGQLMLIREEFEALVEQWPANAPALNMYWVPGVVTNRVSSLMGGVVAFVSALFHLRPECVPRVFKDQMLLLLYNWDSLHHSGLMQQYFWSFHYHSHSYLLDHPARPAEADIAYMGSMLSQTQAMLERDLQVSFDAVKYFVASGEITDPAINLIAVNELEKYGDNIDSEGKFTSFEILYRNIFKRWYLDRGLVQEFARFIAGEPGAVGSHVLDLGAGGGHYTTALNQTGLVTASGYDATVNLLPIEVDLAKELAEFTHGKVNFFDVAKEIPKRSDGKPSMTPADYVFCLEVAEHIPAGASASLFLENLNYLATKGMVISWAGKELCGLGWGHVNCLDMDVKDFIEARTDFLFDANVTEKLRSRSEISWIQKSVSFFRKKGELLHLAEVVHKVEEQVDQTGGAEMTAAAQYYEKVASIRAKAEEMKPTEETKHQKDREKYTQMILNAPVPTVFPRQHAPMGTTEGWVSAPGGKNTPSGMPTTTTVAFSPPAAAPQQSAGMLSTGGLGTGQRPSGASVPPFPSVNLASVGTSASTSVPNNNNIRIMPQQQQHQQSSSSIDQQQHPKLIDLRNVASQASTQSQQTQAKFAGVSPSMIADYEAQGGMGKKIENTIHDARAAIQRGILELDAINEQHRSRRPTGEPAPDLLNYEKVFDALERDYASSEARKTLGLHPRDIKPVDGGQRSEL